MNIINANLHRMPEVSVIGFPALFTPDRVSRITVHLGLYQYEVQGDLRDNTQPIVITKEAGDNFCGTLLTTSPLLMLGVPQLILDPGDMVIPQYTDHYTPAEFEEKYYPG